MSTQKIGKQTRTVLERLSGAQRILLYPGGGAWLYSWDDARKQLGYYGIHTYVWQPVFSGLIRRGWIEEVHRTPGDWVIYGLTEQGRAALAHQPAPAAQP